MRTTFGANKAKFAKVLNLSSTDARVKSYVDEAQERLLYSGKWVDTTARYNVCTHQSCLVWPREIETIEAAAVCGFPIIVRNEWFEFLGGGPGLQSSESCLGALVDRGTVVSFANIPATGYTIAVYCDGSETGQILIRYYDLNGNKVYTTVAGVREEGEYITLPPASGYAYSTYEAMPGGLYQVIKPQTNRPVRLYAYNIASTAVIPIAYYDPDETVPSYRSSLVPSMGSTGSGSCSTTQITIAGKLRLIPIYNDNSVLVIPHAGAVRLACQAVKKEEDNDFEGAAMCWALAYKALNDQVAHYEGDGVVSPIRIEQGNIYGGGGVPNII